MFIGKTFFQFYLLVRLLQLQQVVLFTLDGERLYLFYHGRVYTSYIAQLISFQPELQLPVPKTSNVFIWSLFNICEKQEPKPLLFKPPCIPVQTASPDPIRFKMCGLGIAIFCVLACRYGPAKSLHKGMLCLFRVYIHI